jgi:hypothetical protein
LIALAVFYKLAMNDPVRESLDSTPDVARLGLSKHESVENVSPERQQDRPPAGEPGRILTSRPDSARPGPVVWPDKDFPAGPWHRSISDNRLRFDRPDFEFSADEGNNQTNPEWKYVSALIDLMNYLEEKRKGATGERDRLALRDALAAQRELLDIEAQRYQKALFETDPAQQDPFEREGWERRLKTLLKQIASIDARD